MSLRSRTPVVVLDRDGTIVVDKHYLGDPTGLEFLPGAKEGLAQLAALGCRFVVITNQSGIGRGLLTTEQVERVNEGLREMMTAIGARPEAIYFCPHSPSDCCACRKPQPAMLLQASRELSFPTSSCVVVGDKQSDVEFGRRCSAVTCLIAQQSAHLPHSVAADLVVTGLDELADIIEAQMTFGHLDVQK